MIKTNKSYSKRLRITRTGKILSRKPGQNHFNAKENAKKGMNKKRSVQIFMDNKSRSRFLATI
jgi:ribosomal protein L35